MKAIAVHGKLYREVRTFIDGYLEALLERAGACQLHSRFDRSLLFCLFVAALGR